MRLLLCVFAWAGSALALTTHVGPGDARVGIAMAADDDKPAKRPLRCVRFAQELSKNKQDIELELRSSCRFDVVCSVKWKLTCELDGETTAKQANESTTIEAGDLWTLTASTSSCPEGDWQLEDVQWSCERS